nr:hypothetical protein [Tanacetum cinerariifolium]
MDEIREHFGKNKRKANVGSGSASHAEEFVSSSVTLTPDHEDHEDSVLTHDGNIWTCRTFECDVVLTSNFEHDGADTVVSPNTTSPNVGSPNPHVQMRVEDLDTSVNETINACLPENDANAVSLPRNRAGTSSLSWTGSRTSSSALNDESLIDDFLSLILLTPLQLKTYMFSIGMLPMMLS